MASGSKITNIRKYYSGDTAASTRASLRTKYSAAASAGDPF